MALGFWLRLLIALAAGQVFVNAIGILANFSPLQSSLRQTIVVGVLVLTILADLTALAYFHWVPETPVPLPAPPPAHHMSRKAIKAGVYSAMLAVLFSLVALLIALGIFGFDHAFVMWSVGILLILTLVQDIVTSVVLLRR